MTTYRLSFFDMWQGEEASEAAMMTDPLAHAIRVTELERRNLGRIERGLRFWFFEVVQ